MNDAETPRPPHDDARETAAPGRPTFSALLRRRFSPRHRVGLVLIALYTASTCVLPAALFGSPDKGAKFLQLVSQVYPLPAAAAAGLALAVGGLYQSGGLRELAVTKADLCRCRGEIAAASVPFVTDVYRPSGSLAHAFRRIPLFALQNPDRLAAWIDAIGARRPQFLAVADGGGPSRIGGWSAGAAPHAIKLGRTREIVSRWFLDVNLRLPPRPGPAR